MAKNNCDSLSLFTCGALALRRSSSCPFHLPLPLLSKFQNEFLKALKAKFNMESYAIWVKNFKSEDRFDLRGHSEAQKAYFNFTLKNLDGFLIFCHRVSIAKNTKTMAKKSPNPQKEHPSNSCRRSIRSGPC